MKNLERLKRCFKSGNQFQFPNWVQYLLHKTPKSKLLNYPFKVSSSDIPQWHEPTVVDEMSSQTIWNQMKSFSSFPFIHSLTGSVPTLPGVTKSCTSLSFCFEWAEDDEQRPASWTRRRPKPEPTERLMVATMSNNNNEFKHEFCI